MSKKIISVTDITSYLFCPRKVYLKLVKKIKEPPTPQMILGFLKHKIFDIFNKNEAVLISNITQSLTQEQLTALYNNCLKSITKEISENYSNMIYKFGISADDLLKQTLSFMEKEITLRADSIRKNLSLGFIGKELWRNLKPKYLTEFEIVSPELGLKGRIDRIKIEENIIPYELKTRDRIYDEDKIQLAAYSLLLEQEFGRKINTGVIETSAESKEIEITDDLKKKVFEIAEKIRSMTEDKEPELNQTNLSKCRTCKIRKDCFEI